MYSNMVVKVKVNVFNDNLSPWEEFLLVFFGIIALMCFC